MISQTAKPQRLIDSRHATDCPWQAIVAGTISNIIRVNWPLKSISPTLVFNKKTNPIAVHNGISSGLLKQIENSD